MPIQFLDSRISVSFTAADEGRVYLSRDPLLLGDIGLQTLAAVGTPNQSNIRVQLAGTIGVAVRSGHSSVTIYIQRGGTEVLGSGTIIFTARVDLPEGSGHRLLDLTDGDFPSAEEAASGQIRYTMFAARSGKSHVRVVGPVNFMGTAAAGND